MVGSLRIARLDVDRVTSRRELSDLRREWDELWVSVPDRTPFQSSAWLMPWWSVFGRGELLVLALRDGRRLVGLAPFYKAANEVGRGEIRLLGAGISDYLDVLVLPAHRSALIEAIARELEQAGPGWAFCGFDHLPAHSALLHMTSPRHATEHRTADLPCPVLSLPDAVDELPSTMTAGLWNNLRYSRRRGERDGGTSTEHATADTLDDMLTTLFELHRACWSRRGERGVLADPLVQAFHRAAAPALLQASMLRMFVLRIGAVPAAVYYGLAAARRAYFYISGFDPRFSAVSAGKLATAAAIEHAIAEGAEVFDFLGGREPYKYEWRVVDHPRWCLHFHRTPAEAAW